jgi:hypothetical protein
MKNYLSIILAVTVAGCASYSGIVATGQDSFMVSKQASTSFPGLGNLKADVVKYASRYCESHGKTLQITNETESRPPFILGKYPRAELRFKCTAAGSQG